VKERVVARQILLDAKFEVTKFGSRRDDPPDCEGLLDGQGSAVELTQLMHEKARAQSMKAIKQQPEQPEWYYLWDRDDVLRAIQELIEVKDAKRYQGGPYQRFVLVIYTDEFVLRTPRCNNFWTEQHYPPVCLPMLLSACHTNRLPARTPPSA
jgi:hypothetical protein